MKKFKFKYESILTLRQNAEDDIKNDLAKLISKRQMAIDSLEDFENRQQAYGDDISEMMKRGCSATQLKNIEKGKAYYRKHIHRIKADIEIFNKNIAETQLLLLEAVKSRKIMEKVKENEYQKFIDNVNHEENKVIEEIVNYKNNKRGEGLNG